MPQHGIVIHINAYTRRVIGGYLTISGEKVGKSLNRSQVMAHLVADPDIEVKIKYV